MSPIRADLVPNRTVLHITGGDATHFLQGLVTNDIHKTETGAVYAAILSPQGKYLADFLLIAQNEGYLLDTASDLAPSLAQRLTMYKLRADVQIEATDLTVLRGQDPAPTGTVADPRSPALGWRLYAQTPPEHTPTQIDWTALYVANKIPQTGSELTPNDSYILEYDFERINGVDFRKGCYVGQEVTARMHHKTTLKKGLRLVEISGETSPGTQITANGKPIGTLHSIAGPQALAYLRFDRATGDMQAGDATLTLAD